MSTRNMPLSGQRVVVIGGGSGIGFAVAELAAAQGAEVVIASRDRAKVEAAAARLGSATAGEVDLRDEGSVEAFKALEAFDHLAITAGDWNPHMFGGLRDLDLVQARELLTVRFWGAIAAAKHCADVISPNGSVTLTSGMLAHRPRPGTVMTVASGGAMEFLARGLAVELAPVRVNAVCPGIILTEVVKQRPEAMIKALVDPLPIPRGATPEEAAKAYVYLMSNGYATGQVLPVDGGGFLV